MTGVLVAGWLGLGAVPLIWWLWTRRRVDPWRAMPVPVALVDRTGAVRAQAGPPLPAGLDLADAARAAPAPGRAVRLRTRSGVPLAATGVRGGALVVALPPDPLRAHRDTLLADLGARLAHDINTPLAALVGHLDLVAHEDLTPAAAASVRTCQRELERLRATTADLLTLSRLRASPGPRRICLAGALAEDAASAYLDRADALGVELTVEVPATRVAVEVAEADLVRALRNLVANALQHGLPAPPGDGVPARAAPVTADVVVAVDAAPEAVTFSVADRGPGLDPMDLPRLCAPLVRGPGACGDGSGLGLAVVAEVLAAHGAELRCRPRPGGGTVLTFTLARSR